MTDLLDWADVAAIGQIARAFSAATGVAHPVRLTMAILNDPTTPDAETYWQSEIRERAKHIRTIHAARVACARLRYEAAATECVVLIALDSAMQSSPRSAEFLLHLIGAKRRRERALRVIRRLGAAK